MTRTVRLLLLIAGIGVLVLIVWRAGPELVLGMLAQVGWSFLLIVGVYAAYVVIRAVALWRSVLHSRVRFRDMLRIQLSAEAVEWLTFTGPFLAEPTRGLILTRRHGFPAAAAFAAIATEYLLYMFVSSCLAAAAMSLLLARDLLSVALRPAAIAVLAVTLAFIAACVYAASTGIGLIVPTLRASRVVIGVQRAHRISSAVGQVERVIVEFLHEHPARLASVIVLESAAHALLMLEIWIVMAALGFRLPWPNPLIVEGGVKFTGIAFAFVPGQVGASEAVYTLLVGAIGLPAAAGVTLALLRRMRGLLVAAAGLVALSVAQRSK